ncbi:hypothetical protein ACIBEJ_12545 [Nonomuraea sp. NPDC050790]|uniref:hypothetical protein n=1 Tax=Nonomuraea sp. NPDC050790 TaxID=3364371 RepID=UPI0037ABAD4C
MRALGLLAAALLFVNACGAGQGEAPGAAQPRNDGGNATQRGVHVRNAYLLRGGSLHAVLINSGTRADRLVQLTLAGGRLSLLAPVELPPSGVTGGDRALATASGLEARVGSWVPATFQFQEAGVLAVQVPVKEFP